MSCNNLCNNFEIISGKFPRAETKLFHTDASTKAEIILKLFYFTCNHGIRYHIRLTNIVDSMNKTSVHPVILFQPFCLCQHKLRLLHIIQPIFSLLFPSIGPSILSNSRLMCHRTQGNADSRLL